MLNPRAPSIRRPIKFYPDIADTLQFVRYIQNPAAIWPTMYRDTSSESKTQHIAHIRRIYRAHVGGILGMNQER